MFLLQQKKKKKIHVLSDAALASREARITPNLKLKRKRVTANSIQSKNHHIAINRWNES
jgi:hypothetical protein